MNTRPLMALLTGRSLSAAPTVIPITCNHHFYESSFFPPKNDKFPDWRKSSKMVFSGLMATCIVSYLDPGGVRHAVEIEAETLYEAAVLAMRRFKEHDCEPGMVSKLEVEVRSSIVHVITPQKVRDWLSGGARTPKEMIMKERLRSLL